MNSLYERMCTVDATPQFAWKRTALALLVALAVALLLNWAILNLFGQTSPYRAEHSLVGILLLMAVAALHPQRNESPGKVAGFFLLALIPCYLGTVVSDLDIRLCGIGCHRNPLLHSGLSFFILLWLVRGQHDFLQTLVLGFGVGLASHLLWDVVDYGDVRWLPGGLLDRIWLGSNGFLCLVLAGGKLHYRVGIQQISRN